MLGPVLPMLGWRRNNARDCKVETNVLTTPPIFAMILDTSPFLCYTTKEVTIASATQR